MEYSNIILSFPFPLKEVKPPVVLQNMVSFEVERCKSFKEEITGEVFQDKGGFNNLRFFVMTVNGKPVDPQNTWVAMDGAFVTGMVGLFLNVYITKDNILISVEL